MLITCVKNDSICVRYTHILIIFVLLIITSYTMNIASISHRIINFENELNAIHRAEYHGPVIHTNELSSRNTRKEFLKDQIEKLVKQKQDLKWSAILNN